MKNVDRLQEMNQVNGSMVEAKREVLKGASTTGLFTLKGD